MYYKFKCDLTRPLPSKQGGRIHGIAAIDGIHVSIEFMGVFRARCLWWRKDMHFLPSKESMVHIVSPWSIHGPWCIVYPCSMGPLPIHCAWSIHGPISIQCWCPSRIFGPRCTCSLASKEANLWEAIWVVAEYGACWVGVGERRRLRGIYCSSMFLFFDGFWMFLGWVFGVVDWGSINGPWSIAHGPWCMHCSWSMVHCPYFLGVSWESDVACLDAFLVLLGISFQWKVHGSHAISWHPHGMLVNYGFQFVEFMECLQSIEPWNPQGILGISGNIHSMETMDFI